MKTSLVASFNTNSQMENEAVGLFQATLNGEYLTANQMLAEIYGYKSAQELINHITSIKKQIYIDTNRHSTLINLLKNQKIVNQYESQVYRKDGSIIWISETIWSIYDAYGTLISYRGIVEEITERKQSEIDNLSENQAIHRHKSNFISLVSHELKSSLTVILMSSDLLKIHYQRMKEQDRVKCLNKIANNVKNMLETLEGFLAIGKAEAVRNVKADSINITNFCQQIWQDVQDMIQGGQKLEFTNTDSGRNLIADRALLRQILVNLLLNASKYSPLNSTVHLNVAWRKDQIILTIKDEGVGISEDDQAHLFELFYRGQNVSKVSGTGLGLFIVKQAVELHGGNIAVASQVGCGTTFTVTLPTQCTPISALDQDNYLLGMV